MNTQDMPGEKHASVFVMSMSTHTSVKEHQTLTLAGLLAKRASLQALLVAPQLALSKHLPLHASSLQRSRVKMGVEDPDAPKPPPSALRKAGELPSLADPANDGESVGGRRHIKFNEADLEGLLNEEHGSGVWA